ncbi:MAG: tetratricopeptide repeat protein [Rhodobacteraceae bacterium]|nr:tetratricopeptide repeat protein [Paracoccaceae bacterium]
MTLIRQRLKSAVAVVAILMCGTLGAQAQDTNLDDLFDALRDAEGQAAEAIESRIWQEWSKSGSPSMDLLLSRGREALEAGNTALAIEHFTALVDHAPEFAEAYNARATAYFQAEMYGPSIADIERVLALNPRHFGAMSGLALILGEIGRTSEALEVYRMVEEIYPAREGLKEQIEALEREVEGQTI